MFCHTLLFLKTTKLKKRTTGRKAYKKMVLEKTIMSLHIIVINHTFVSIHQNPDEINTLLEGNTRINFQHMN